MGPNFDVSASPNFATEVSKKFESLNIQLVAADELVFVSRVFILIIIQEIRVQGTVPLHN